MKISRRDLLQGAGTIALFGNANRAEAWSHGAATNGNRVTINTIGPIPPTINIAKTFSWPTIDPTIVDANGYLNNTTIGAGISSSQGWDSNWFGDWIWKWTGLGSMWLPYPLIVRETDISGTPTGGVISGLGGTSGNVSTAVISGKTTPRVVFSFGSTVTAIANSSVSNGAGGTYIDVTVTNIANMPGSIIQIQDGSIGGTIVGQRNAIGLWNYTLPGGNVLRLTTNVVTGVASAYNAGSAWVSGGEAIGQASNLSTFLGSAGGGTFTGFTDLVICKGGTPSGYAQTYEQLITAGQINDPDYVTQLKYLFNHANAPMSQRGWIRFLDVDGERGYQCDSALRVPKASLTYANANGSYFVPAGVTNTYWGGNITTVNGTDFSILNPSGRGTGAYADNEVVQGIFSLSSPSTNTSLLPTLQLGSRGTAPIYVEANVANIQASFAAAPTVIGQTVTFSFSASWLAGSPVSYTYNAVAGDVNNLGAFLNNLAADMTANGSIGTATTKINFVISATLQILARNAQAGALTVTYTGGTGPVPTLYRVPASSFTTAQYTTFVYSTTLGGWIWLGNGGMVMSTPWELIVELCNQVGAHCYINWPLYTKGQYITDQTNFFGDGTTGLTSGLRFGTETANEIWLAQVAGPYGQALWLGSSLGFPYPSGGTTWGCGGLRCLQYSELSKPAWAAKGRAPSDHYIILQSQIGNNNTAIGSAFDSYALLSSLLNTSTNALYASYGGLGGTAGTDYHTSPNRLCDKITATGHATYWFDDYIGEVATEINGTVTANAGWLQASKDYANGNTSTAFSALANLFSVPGTGVTHLGGDWQTFGLYFAAMEGMVAQYDNSSGRSTNLVNPKIAIMHYEAGPQWSFNTNLTNGTNSVNDSVSLTALATQMSNLGWDVSAYGSSSTDYSGVAQKVINMTQGWKNDLAGLSPTVGSGTPANTGSYKNMIKTNYYQALVSASVGKNREVKPAQYGYQRNTWGLFPSVFILQNPYTNYDAIHEWNT